MVDRHAIRRAARRQVKPGFPWEGSFKTKEQVDEYFAHDTIICLLCGKHYRKLGVHLRSCHDFDEADYKVRYGLPTFRGLTSRACHDAYSEAIISDPDRIKHIQGLGLELGGTAVKKGQKHRRVPEYRARMSAELALSVNGMDQPYGVRDKHRFLSAIARGNTPREIAKLEGFPGLTTVAQWRKSDPKFAAAYDEVLELLPYPAQARMEKMGRAFREDLRRLFDKGESDKAAAKMLGVTAMTCNRITKKWREERHSNV